MNPELKPGDVINVDRTRVGGTHERYLVVDVAPGHGSITTGVSDSSGATFTLLQDPESPGES